MSLKFGIYLVEQGILTCDQFCGLVKIQQSAVASPGSVAIAKNLMTVKQVAQVLDALELNPGKSFSAVAQAFDFLDPADAQLLERAQAERTPTLEKLLVECGVLTSRQVETLQRAYERGTATALTPAPTEPAPLRREPVPQPKFRQRPIVVRSQEALY